MVLVLVYRYPLYKITFHIMIHLPTVTLCAVSSVRIDETLNALKRSMRGITFARAVFLTDKKITVPHEGIEIIPIRTLSYEDYSRFMLYELTDYIDTDFVLIVQHDGYVLRPHKWNHTFLSYDYIGAPWRSGTFFTTDGVEVRVGNGGFSLRSKQLLELPSKLAIPFTDAGTGFFNEDGFLCLHHRQTCETNGIQFAPVAIASLFSRERWCPDSILFPFGFHSNRRGFKGIRRFIKKIFTI